jgi:hypothetical protein
MVAWTQATNFIYIKQYSNQSGLTEYSSGTASASYNLETLPIGSFLHDTGCILLCAEYGYPKASPNTNNFPLQSQYPQ